MEMNNYKKYITGLKGMSCIFIMIGHFLGIYKYAQQFQPSISLLDTIFNSQLSFLLDESYWLYLFFIVSGYLVAQSKIKTIRDFIIKSFNRFFRFAFPIFFAYFVIYLIYLSVGFHNNNTIDFFKCDWFQNAYPGQYSIAQVFRSPIDVLILGKSSLNSPYWVLSEMFIGSVLIYLLKWCYSYLSNKNESICFSVLIIITFATYIISPIISSCLIGMLVSMYVNKNEISNKSYFAFWTLFVAMAFYILPRTFISNIFFVSLIIFVPKVKFLNYIFSSKLFMFLGKISWGIYSFHWPLMCSLGSILLIKLQPQTGLFNSYAISSVLIALITLVVSVIFYLTFERLSAYLSAVIDKFIKQITARFVNKKKLTDSDLSNYCKR